MCGSGQSRRGPASDSNERRRYNRFRDPQISFRELVLILLVVAAGTAFVWNETGRDNALLSAAAIMLGIFAVGGAVAVVFS
ncbi:MAG: hypothetical protein AAB092_05630 [Chloroflexota bacterium]